MQLICPQASMQILNLISRLKNAGGLQVHGPPIIAAIESGNIDILDFLVTECRANFDQEIIWDENVSTVFIFAMAKAIE